MAARKPAKASGSKRKGQGKRRTTARDPKPLPPGQGFRSKTPEARNPRALDDAGRVGDLLTEDPNPSEGYGS